MNLHFSTSKPSSTRQTFPRIRFRFPTHPTREKQLRIPPEAVVAVIVRLCTALCQTDRSANFVILKGKHARQKERRQDPYDFRVLLAPSSNSFDASVYQPALRLTSCNTHKCAGQRDRRMERMS